MIERFDATWGVDCGPSRDVPGARIIRIEGDMMVRDADYRHAIGVLRSLREFVVAMRNCQTTADAALLIFKFSGLLRLADELLEGEPLEVNPG